MSALAQRARHRAFLWRAARRAGVRRLAAFGPGSVILPPVTILSPHRIEIGSGVLVAEGTSFYVVERYRGRTYEPRLRIGDRSLISQRVWFSCVGEIEVGPDVQIGHGVLIADSFHEYMDRSRPVQEQPMAEPRPVRIGAGAIVGPGAAILSGSEIGSGSYVAANAVVAGKFPAHCVVAGNPARLIRRWDGERGGWVDDPDPDFAPILEALTRPR
jgi:acetyltransferase-like isoleucine patch superfamily enzyme